MLLLSVGFYHNGFLRNFLQWKQLFQSNWFLQSATFMSCHIVSISHWCKQCIIKHVKQRAHPFILVTYRQSQPSLVSKYTVAKSSICQTHILSYITSLWPEFLITGCDNFCSIHMLTVHLKALLVFCLL